MTGPLLPPRVRKLFRLPIETRADVSRDVDEELAFHIEMRAREFENAGLAAEVALSEARRRFGDVKDVRSHALAVSEQPRRHARLRESLLSWLHDVRIAMRQFRSAPMFSCIAVLTLALGIGANTAMFSVIHHLLLAPLPYADGDRMTQLNVAMGKLSTMPDRATIEAWRGRARSFDDFMIVRTGDHLVDDGVDELRMPGAAIEANYFSFLGRRPAAGRAFTAEDMRPGSAPVSIIGYAFWRQRYGGSLAALGQHIVVDSVSRTIVGIAGPRLGIPFDDRDAPAIWIPIVAAKQRADGATDQFQVVGKLRVGVSTVAAAAELSSIVRSMRPPPVIGILRVSSANVMRPQDLLSEKYRRALVLLFAAVSAVLMIACANVAHLLLARAWGRQREFAIRGALGASRARLARQMLCESVVLAIAGGVLGLLVAFGALRLMISLRPIGFDGLSGVRVEPAVVGWTLGVSLLSAIAFGFGPAFFAGARRNSDLLKAGTRVANVSGGARRARGSMIIVEVALSVALLVVAGLLLRSYEALLHVPLGFDPRNLSAVRVNVPSSTPKADRPAIFADVLAAIRAIPGIRGASIGGLPLQTAMLMGDLEPQGGRPAGVPPVRLTGLRVVQANFFMLAGIQLRGNTFSGDTTGRTPPPTDEIVISQGLARRLWPNGGVIGGRLRLNARSDWKTVVGIAGNLAVPGRTGDPYDFQVYEPAPTTFTSSVIVFRQSRPLESLAPAIRRAVAAASHGAGTVMEIRTSDADLHDILAGPRFATALLGTFSVVALLLSAIGLYGVISYAVGQRTHEIGVRVALGAQPRDVIRLVARESGILVTVGLIVGLAVAVTAARGIQSYLFDVAPLDVATYASVSLLLAGVALLACSEPARRAMGVDPIVALGAD
jgi:predicted permease